MEPGTLVWCDQQTGDKAWILAEVVKRTDDELTLKDTKKSDNVFTRPSEVIDAETGAKKFKGVELSNTPLSEEERAEGRDDDLITLPHLHEPAILHAIAERFFHNKIYTWTGPVLIAVNPFQRLPLYTEEIKEAYRREGLFRSQGMGTPGSDLEPHIFAVADRSYRQMMQEQRKSQAILISGESGAGKTESTKIVMFYLTTLGNMGMAETEEGGEMSTMEKVLQSNPVLEAFGNARTLRNDNSSRFGKFIELGFTRAGHLIGAKVQTYLLEKVRLAFHASGERNYHIFYQILRGASEEDKKKYEFNEGDTGGMELPMYYHFTGQGGAPHLREFTDESGMAYTIKAMKNLGWAQETIDSVMSLCAGIIHLGQIQFNKKIDPDSGLEVADIDGDKSVPLCARLMGVDEEKLKVALTERIIMARGQEIKTLLSIDNSMDARDALAKTIYGALFLWVVEQVNTSIMWENDSDVRSSVGVLDIFGFECFAINSFEQLCINFTNEALQQQFNKFIFKLEQAEYEAESIDWAFISFPDNQDCLDTIQKPKTGILAMLDDECRLPKGSDRNFCKRLCDQYLPEKNQTTSDNTRFVASKIQQSKGMFCVRHFAGLVEYSAETNFMEKNKDEIPLTAKNMFETAPTQLVKDVYDVQKRETEGRKPAAEANKPGRKPASKTVGQQFKEQLNSLIENVSKTDPHYIRCLKPNDAAKPKMLTRKRLTEQLRYGGVLEAVRVARAGYPVRLVHEQFFQRYRMLLPQIPGEKLPWNMEGQVAQDLCVKLVDVALAEGQKKKEALANGPLDPKEEGISKSEKIRRMLRQPAALDFPKTDVQLGKTKVFMRKPPHDILEAHRVFQQHANATVIQCWVRGLIAEKKFLEIQHATRMIQRFYRGSKGRERWWKLRGEAAGQLLTVNFRMLVLRRKYMRARKGTIKLQAVIRGRNTRKTVAATQIQKVYRKYAAEKKFRKMQTAVVSLQCCTRVKQATKIMNELKREQKDVGKLKQNNEKLKSEMASLRAMLAAQAKEGASEAKSAKEMAEKQNEIDKLEKRVAQLEKELEEAKKVVEKLEADMKKQQSQFASDKDQLEQRIQYASAKSVSTGKRTSTVMPVAPSSPQSKRKVTDVSELNLPPIADGEASVTVNPELIAQQRAHVQQLEDQLDAEKRLRREADGEIIKLRAAINGVKLDDTEVDALLGKKKGAQAPAPNHPKVVDLVHESSHDEKPRRQTKQRSSLVQATADFLPKIRRGFFGGEEKEEENVVSSGWKVEVRTRKEREETLRDGVHQFEIKLKKFNHLLEEGVETVMWQLNRSAEQSASDDEFAVKASHVTIKMQRKGDLYLQSVLNFNLRGGYLSKAIGRNRQVDKTALEPLSLGEILEVKAGCAGFDHTELPAAAGREKKSKSKSKKSKGESENRQTSLFLTVKATPTPIAHERSYIIRFKSRSARNDILHGLRSVLADMQIQEGVSISGLHFNQQSDDQDDEKIMVPLNAVNQVINKEREAYDRILLMLLQGGEDLKDKEDELLSLRSKLESVVQESAEKDRVQANDSKLIMQLSKKLETLLMDNEDLRDQNDRLNTRLVAVECEKMNLLAASQGGK